MNTTILLLLVCGLGFGAGAMVLAGAITGTFSRDPAAVFRPRRRGPLQAWYAREGRAGVARVLFAVALGVLAWWLTGWPVAAILVTGLAVGVPWLFGAGRVSAARIDRIDALSSWCRRLRDMVATGQTSLGQAVRESAATAPAPIATEVGDLAQRMRTWDFTTAARRFADEIDDPVGDQIAAALIISYQQGAGVARVLTGLAAAVDVEVAARRDIEAERAGPRRTARILVLIYLAMLGALSLSGSYLAPYDGLLGQLVLVALTGIIIGSLVWLRRLSIATVPARFLVDSESGERP